MGAVPPLTTEAWQVAFTKYQLTPEYLKVNQGMDLSGFKSIFFLEWLHRFIGRLIGLVLFIPFLILMLKRQMKPTLWFELLTLLALLGMQGLLGWLMVSSGLVDNPRVSPYRLVIHLEAALLLLSVTYFYALEHGFRISEAKSPGTSLGENHPTFKFLAVFTLAVIGIQIALGGFVSGLKAGGVSATWPTMDGSWIPAHLFALKPWFLNFTENPITAHFVHRSFAYVAALTCLGFAFYGLRFQVSKRQKVFLMHLIALVILQMFLGINVVLLHVPVSVASAHQLVAIGLWVSALFLVVSSFRNQTK
jgi:cytochrome c oxidase assembly protein subunit 15